MRLPKTVCHNVCRLVQSNAVGRRAWPPEPEQKTRGPTGPLVLGIRSVKIEVEEAVQPIPRCAQALGPDEEPKARNRYRDAGTGLPSRIRPWSRYPGGIATGACASDNVSGIGHSPAAMPAPPPRLPWSCREKLLRTYGTVRKDISPAIDSRRLALGLAARPSTTRLHELSRTPEPRVLTHYDASRRKKRPRPKPSAS